MNYIFLAKWVVMALIISSVLGMVSYKSYVAGENHEKSIWEHKEVERQQKTALVVAKNTEEKERGNNKLLEIISQRDDLNEKLNNAHDRIADKRMFITSQDQVCNSRVREAENTVESGRATGRIELSAAFARKIRNDYFKAQQVVIQYNACRAELRNIAEIAE